MKTTVYFDAESGRTYTELNHKTCIYPAMTLTIATKQAAQALGRLGGSQTTPAQTKARKLNGSAPCGHGKKRGRPAKVKAPEHT